LPHVFGEVPLLRQLVLFQLEGRKTLVNIAGTASMQARPV
jgi:hypothetical protein